jgi:predicted deacetylase
VTRALLVALHDVQPRSFTRVREIRTWLLERDVKRATLLVIPAPDHYPIGSHGPALTNWLRGRTACGDAVAQHGLAHRAVSGARWPRSLLASWQGGAAAEFPGLGAADTASRIDAGRCLLAQIELDPRGFVAPGYAYTSALRAILAGAFDWFADLRGIHGSQGVVVHSHALCLGTSTRLK